MPEQHSITTTRSAFNGASVDVQKRQITGFVVTSIGPAIGHGEMIDEESLRQVVALGNGSGGPGGLIRARMDHPPHGDMTVENPLSKLLGRPFNFRIDGEAVRADLQLLSAAAAPEADRLMSLAKEAPDLFGASLVFDYADPKSHMAKVKRGENPPVRFGAILAVDFVDLPATNPSGLFSATPTKEPDMAKGKLAAYVRNGGLFCAMGGDEYELEMPNEWKGGKADADDDDEGGEQGAKGGKGSHARGTQGQPLDAEAIAAAAVTKEREYAGNFHTAMTTAGISGKQAEDFRTSFYGRTIEDVKFLASHAIGNRAKAVGEGSGDAGDDAADTPEAKAKKAEEKFEKEVTQRWVTDAGLRRMHGVRTTNVSDPLYQSRLARFIQVEKKCRADEAGGDGVETDKEPGDSDPITKVLKNKAVTA